MVEKKENPWVEEFPPKKAKPFEKDPLRRAISKATESSFAETFGLEPNRSSKDVWYYEDKLRWYFIAIGKDNQALETLYNFPERLYLPKSWNNAFKEVAKDTRNDRYERFSVLAIDQTSNRVLLPLKAVRGEPHKIPHGLRQEHFKWAEDSGADTVIGSFHSHPTEKKKSLFRRFLFDTTLSAADFYSIVRDGHEYVKGVIQVNNQIAMIFKSKESRLESDLSYLPSGYKDQNSFSDYWYRTKGLTYDPSTNTVIPTDKRKLNKDEWLDMIWDINHDLAEKHHLSLYRGGIGGSLGRFYPHSINNDWHNYFLGRTNEMPKPKRK